MRATSSFSQVTSMPRVRIRALEAISKGLFLTLSLCLITCIPSHVYAQAGSQSPSADFESLKQQGITYFNKKMFPLAQEQFDLAYATPKGKTDFVVIYYRGFLAEQQLKLELAFEMAELAVSISEEDSREREQAQQLLDKLQGRFSYVNITAASEETNQSGRIYLESKGRIINRKKRQQFESIRMRFRSMDVQLPAKIYLPYGRYTANNVPFEIKRGAEEIPEVSIFLHIIKTEGDKGGGDNLWLYTGLGVTGAALIGLGAFFFLQPEPVEQGRAKVEFQANPFN